MQEKIITNFCLKCSIKTPEEGNNEISKMHLLIFSDRNTLYIYLYCPNLPPPG